MSLKAFHVIFISLASAMLFGVGGWKIHAYRSPEGATGDLVWGIVAIAAGVGLIVYERFFLKKTKDVGYL